MPNRRTYTDQQLIEAVAAAKSWGDVMEGVGKKRNQNRANVLAYVTRLGLDTSHIAGVADRQVPVVPDRPHAFRGRGHAGKGRTGLAVACGWFLNRGYNVSLPLEAAPYDLVAESDDGLKRVQVKMTSQPRNGRYEVRLTRAIYDPAATPNTHGGYRRTPYTADDVDLFFIVAGRGTYLIPIEYVAGLTGITLDVKYAAFLVE